MEYRQYPEIAGIKMVSRDVYLRSVYDKIPELAAATGSRVQTHCSESDWEHDYVLDRTGRTDTEALLELGLLSRSTVLAHADLASTHDLSLMRNHGAGVGVQRDQRGLGVAEKGSPEDAPALVGAGLLVRRRQRPARSRARGRSDAARRR